MTSEESYWKTALCRGGLTEPAPSQYKSYPSDPYTARMLVSRSQDIAQVILCFL